MMRQYPKLAVILTLLLGMLPVGVPSSADAASVSFADLTVDNIVISGCSPQSAISLSEVRVPDDSGVAPVSQELSKYGSFENTSVSVLYPFEEATAIATGANQNFSNTTLFAHAVSGAASGDYSASAGDKRSLYFLAFGPTTVRVSLQYTSMHGVTSNEWGFPSPAYAESRIWITITENGTDGFTSTGKLVSSGISWETPDITPFETGTIEASLDFAGIGTGWIFIEAGARTRAEGSGMTPLPGQTQTTPVLPGPGGSSDSFEFSVDLESGGLGRDFPIFVDPPAVSGFAYSVEPGDPNFASVVLPTDVDTTDGTFELWVPDGGGDFAFDSILTEGAEHFFPEGGLSSFQIRDIEPMLDPDDPSFDTAFPTGLTFVGSGSANITMSPIPEPSTLALATLGLLGVCCCVRRRKP